MDDLKTINRVFTIWSDELEGRLDPKFYSPITLAWNEEWKIEKLGKFLERRLEIFPADELSEENFATLSLTGEVKPKRIMGWRRMKGALFSSKFFKAKEGDFVFSKIDIRNGASAVIPKGREIAVTAEFPVYSVSSEILPEYLALLFRYKQVLSWLDRKSIGHSGRKRTDGKVIEALPVPIPPIAIQKEMVERLGNAIQEKKKKEQEIRDILSSIDTFVLGELGVEVPEGGAEEKIFTVWSDTVEKRLDPLFFHPMRIKIIEAIKKSGATTFSLNEVANFRREIVNEIPENTPYVGLENIVSNSGEYIKTKSKEDISSAFVFKKGDILFPKLRPYLNKVFLADFDGVCSTEFHVLEAEKCDRRFLFSFLTRSIVIEQVRKLMTGNTLPRLQTEDIENLLIPVPTEKTQLYISEKVEAIYKKGRQLRDEAEEIILEAQKKSEQMLFAKV